MSEQILREALERIVALHDRVDIVEAQDIAEAALASPVRSCICRPVGAGDGDTYAIDPRCPAHGEHGTAPVRAYHVTRYPYDEQRRTIENVTEVYVFASNGFVNTRKRGEANTTQTRTTAEVELQIGQRMIVERGDGVLSLEVLP